MPSLFIFLDALDECDQAEVKSLVKFLARMTTRASNSHSRLSVCMSSRDYPHINVDKCSEVRTDISNGQDIIRFVESELDPLFREEDEFKKEIIRKASGIFLWVVLVVNRLVDEKDKGQDKKTMQAVSSHSPTTYTISSPDALRIWMTPAQHECWYYGYSSRRDLWLLQNWNVRSFLATKSLTTHFPYGKAQWMTAAVMNN